VGVPVDYAQCLMAVEEGCYGTRVHIEDGGVFSEGGLAAFPAECARHGYAFR